MLPEKLKERRSSLNLPPTNTRKRGQPGAESTGQIQERPGVAESVKASGSREHSATPSRSRTLPSDYLAKLAKRNSLPDPVMSIFADQMPNSQPIGFNSPSTASPMSPNYQFTPQLGNAQIPDLKNVMFPSDNPFAYPSQAMSTLDSSNDGQYSFSDASMTPNESNLFGTPSSGTHQIPQFGGYDFAFQQAVHENPTLAQQLAGQPTRDFNAPFSDLLMQSGLGGDMSQLGGSVQGGVPATTTAGEVNMADANISANLEEYWKRANGGQMSMSNGLPLQAMNVDYFGSEGWNPAWGEQHYGNGQQ